MVSPNPNFDEVPRWARNPMRVRSAVAMGHDGSIQWKKGFEWVHKHPDTVCCEWVQGMNVYFKLNEDGSSYFRTRRASFNALSGVQHYNDVIEAISKEISAGAVSFGPNDEIYGTIFTSRPRHHHESHPDHAEVTHHFLSRERQIRKLQYSNWQTGPSGLSAKSWSENGHSIESVQIWLYEDVKSTASSLVRSADRSRRYFLSSELELNFDNNYLDRPYGVMFYNPTLDVYARMMVSDCDWYIHEELHCRLQNENTWLNLSNCVNEIRSRVYKQMPELAAIEAAKKQAVESERRAEAYKRTVKKANNRTVSLAFNELTIK